MKAIFFLLVVTLLCIASISAKPKPPPPIQLRNTLHGYILCEAGVISDVVKGTKHVSLWEPHRKEMEAAANAAKACLSKKDENEVKKCEIEIKPKIVDIIKKFTPKLKAINPEFEFVLTFLIVQRCYPIRPDDILH